MKWSGETEQQMINRIKRWHPYYCVFPTQMRNGNWVWLERVWRRSHGLSGYYFEYDDSDTKPDDDVPMSTLTSSKPIKK